MEIISHHEKLVRVINIYPIQLSNAKIIQMRYKQILRIATRKSPLALWQANHVKNKLEATHPALEVELIGLLTEGDKLLTTSLMKIGGKGLFVKELEKALVERRADIAVHSIKDLPTQLHEELILAAVCEREDPRDVFVSNRHACLSDVPQTAIIGTSSLRRACQLKALRSDLIIKNLRGNVGTRLEKLDNGSFTAIILAAAGLKRLNAENRITHYFPHEHMLPAIGQGAIGVECHKDNRDVLEILKTLEHPPTRICITAERAMNYQLQGGCQLPIAGFAQIISNQLVLSGMVCNPENNEALKITLSANPEQAQVLGEMVAKELIKTGADKIINQFYA